ncbi:sensor histidine kinase [Halorubellus litoreus]|uniref:histidine kinase n=1 Tax=Halorubellus litoreus TaxID=755308 RepID=A0ABD5VKQ2_9EURY
MERERQLRQQNERPDEFASVISHDLRNPLNVAEARATILAEQAESEHLEPLLESLDRIEAIVEDTLTLARQGNTIHDVSVRVGRHGEREIYVEDDGPGIPTDERDAVFEPGHSSDSGGTGFGLTIVKRIVEAHGWELAVSDGIDGGARFEFETTE